MTCVILQPSYIPWRGYFHQIQKADVFVFYDDVQYDKHGWRNRNKIKTANGPAWLTIPVSAKGNVTESRPIREIEIAPGHAWERKHLGAISQSYRHAPYYQWLLPKLTEWYHQVPVRLADFTIPLTMHLAMTLGLGDRTFVRSSTLGVGGGQTERLVSIAKAVNCRKYVSGPSAKDYLEESMFADSGVELSYMRYEYPTYAQLHPPFEPHVSVLDLLMMHGPDSNRFIWTN